MTKLFIFLYIALIVTPSGTVEPVSKQVSSYGECLKIKGAEKNKNYTFIHEACHVVQVPVPPVIETIKPKPKVNTL